MPAAFSMKVLGRKAFTWSKHCWAMRVANSAGGACAGALLLWWSFVALILPRRVVDLSRPGPSIVIPRMRVDNGAGSKLFFHRAKTTISSMRICLLYTAYMLFNRAIHVYVLFWAAPLWLRCQMSVAGAGAKRRVRPDRLEVDRVWRGSAPPTMEYGAFVRAWGEWFYHRRRASHVPAGVFFYMLPTVNRGRFGLQAASSARAHTSPRDLTVAWRWTAQCSVPFHSSVRVGWWRSRVHSIFFHCCRGEGLALGNEGVDGAPQPHSRRHTPRSRWLRAI